MACVRTLGIIRLFTPWLAYCSYCFPLIFFRSALAGMSWRLERGGGRGEGLQATATEEKGYNRIIFESLYYLIPVVCTTAGAQVDYSSSHTQASLIDIIYLTAKQRNVRTLQKLPSRPNTVDKKSETFIKNWVIVLYNFVLHFKRSMNGPKFYPFPRLYSVLKIGRIHWNTLLLARAWRCFSHSQKRQERNEMELEQKYYIIQTHMRPICAL